MEIDTHIGITKSGREVSISSRERNQHTAILGASGGGKSVVLEHFARQDMKRGDGLLLLDVAGSLAETVLHHVPRSRHNQVCYLRVSDEFPVGLNILEDTRPDARAVVADAMVSAMRGIWSESWGPRLETILRHSIRALIEVPNASLLMVPRLLTDRAYRKTVVRRVNDPFTRNFFEQQYEAWRDSFRDEAIASVLNKVEAFLSFPAVRNILGQGRSTLHLDQAMARGRIVIANLSKTEIGDTAACLMGAFLLANVASNLAQRGGPDFHLLIDEAHNFGGVHALSTLLQEARKFGVSCTVVTQHLAALDAKTRAALLGNVHTMICFRMGREDAELLAPTFNREHQTFNPYVLQHLERGEAVVRVGGEDAAIVDMPPRVTGAGDVNAVKKQSRLHYGIPREKAEANIMRALT